MGTPPLAAQQTQTDHSGDVSTERGHVRRCGEASNMPKTTQRETTQHGEQTSHDAPDMEFEWRDEHDQAAGHVI